MVPQKMKPAKWWEGTIKEWDALPLAERERIAFEATGCQVAYCTWPAPVECLHTGCRIARGELAPIELTQADREIESICALLAKIRGEGKP